MGIVSRVAGVEQLLPAKGRDHERANFASTRRSTRALLERIRPIDFHWRKVSRGSLRAALTGPLASLPPASWETSLGKRPGDRDRARRSHGAPRMRQRTPGIRVDSFCSLSRKARGVCGQRVRALARSAPRETTRVSTVAENVRDTSWGGELGESRALAPEKPTPSRCARARAARRAE